MIKFSLEEFLKLFIVLLLFLVSFTSLSVFDNLHNREIELSNYCMDDKIPLEYRDATFAEHFNSVRNSSMWMLGGVIACFFVLIVLEFSGKKVVFEIPVGNDNDNGE